jgi:hypothetical protein
MFRAFKRLFIWLGLMAEKATENRRHQPSRGRARHPRCAGESRPGQHGQRPSRRPGGHVERSNQAPEPAEAGDPGPAPGRRRANDEDNGAHYAEELANIEQDIADNDTQLQGLEQLYQQNKEIIAQSLREVQKFQREFETLKTRVAVGKNLDGLATLMKAASANSRAWSAANSARAWINSASPPPVAKAR